MATYSAFFSSGLLAPYHDLSYTSTSSPSQDYSSPIDPEVDEDSHMEFSSPIAEKVNLFNTTTTDRPKLRKRRSSLNMASSPMSSIRSPARNATAAARYALSGTASPTRSRSGSVSNTGQATQSNSLMGRLRSGSVNNGTNLRPKRTIRKSPTAPPPTVPLPAIPCTPPSSATTPIIKVPQPPRLRTFQATDRPPLSRRTNSVDNYNALFGIADIASKMAIATPDISPIDGTHSWDTIDEDVKEN